MGNVISVSPKDKNGNITQIIDPNEGIAQYKYDLDNKVTEEKNAIGAVHSYTYNADELLEEYKDANNRTTTYKYDNIGRIVSKTDEAGTIIYEYDANSNRKTYRICGR